MKTCDRCGRPSEYSRCTLCESIERERREDFEREEQSREERLEQLRENAERVTEAWINPGDYDCPECRYRTLKNRASRCPKCQANIGTEYWNRVDEINKEEVERKKAAAKVAQEKWEREAPARAMAARDAAEKEARAAAIDKSKEFLAFFYGYMLPILCVLSGKLIIAGGSEAFVQEVQKDIFGTLLIFVPILNWLLTLILLFSHDGPLVLMTLICSGLAGLVIGYVIRKS